METCSRDNLGPSRDFESENIREKARNRGKFEFVSLKGRRNEDESNVLFSRLLPPCSHESAMKGGTVVSAIEGRLRVARVQRRRHAPRGFIRVNGNALLYGKSILSLNLQSRATRPRFFLPRTRSRLNAPS